jgi:hypothetical protein
LVYDLRCMDTRLIACTGVDIKHSVGIGRNVEDTLAVMQPHLPLKNYIK